MQIHWLFTVLHGARHFLAHFLNICSVRVDLQRLSLLVIHYLRIVQLVTVNYSQDCPDRTNSYIGPQF
jgi:hypothetical protein